MFLLKVWQQHSEAERHLQNCGMKHYYLIKNEHEQGWTAEVQDLNPGELHMDTGRFIFH